MMSLRERAAAAGLDAATITGVLELAPSSVYRVLDGELPGRAARATAAIIAAWEIMTPEQRLLWLMALGVPAERPRRGRPLAAMRRASCPCIVISPMLKCWRSALPRASRGRPEGQGRLCSVIGSSLSHGVAYTPNWPLKTWRYWLRLNVIDRLCASVP